MEEQKDPEKEIPVSNDDQGVAEEKKTKKEKEAKVTAKSDDTTKADEAAKAAAKAEELEKTYAPSPELEKISQSVHKLKAEIQKVVVGQGQGDGPLACRYLQRRAYTDRRCAWHCQNTHGQATSANTFGKVLPHPVYPRPDACGCDRDQCI